MMGYVHSITCCADFIGVYICQSLSGCTLQIDAVYFMLITSVNKLPAILSYLCNSILLQIVIILSHHICIIVGS